MQYFVFILAFCFFSSFVTSGRLKFKDENELRGVLLLDPTTFPKIVPSGRYSTIVLFCNKATVIKDDYGSYQREQFATFTQQGDLSKVRDLLYAQVIINGGYGSQLAERVGVINNAEIPQIFLYKKGSKKPIKFPFIRMTVATLRRFAHKHTGFWHPGTSNIRPLDDLSNEFMETNNGTTRLSIIESAKSIVDDVLPEQKKIAEFYVHVMEKVISDGFEWAEKESDRLYRILVKDENLNEAKANFIDAKLDITSIFDVSAYMDPNREIPEFTNGSDQRKKPEKEVGGKNSERDTTKKEKEDDEEKTEL